MARMGFDRREPSEPDLSGLDPAQHVQRIVEAAERTAIQIREEAEAEAQRYLEEYKRRVDQLVSERLQLTETLAEQTGRIKDQYDRFLSALDGALRKIGDVAGNGQSATSPSDFPRRFATASDEAARGPDPLAPPDEPEHAEQSRSWSSGWRPKARELAEPEPHDSGPETTPGGYRPRPAAKGERLLAIQLLAAGEGRVEVERRLREEYGMSDPGTLIDELLGA